MRDAATGVVIAMVDAATSAVRVVVARALAALVAHVLVVPVVHVLVALVARALAVPVAHVPVAQALAAHRAAHARHVQRRVGRGLRRARHTANSADSAAANDHPPAHAVGGFSYDA